MIADPWFPPQPSQSESERKYYFGRTHQRIRFFVLETAGNFAIVSVATNKQTSVKLLDWYAGSTWQRAKLILAAVRFARKHHAAGLVIPQSIIAGNGMLRVLQSAFKPKLDHYFFSTDDQNIIRSIPYFNYSTTNGDKRFW